MFYDCVHDRVCAQPRAFDANKLYASEILAILLQGSAGAQAALGALDGIEALLLAVAPFKRKGARGACTLALPRA
jgi:beta-catenin-like protein 1